MSQSSPNPLSSLLGVIEGRGGGIYPVDEWDRSKIPVLWGWIEVSELFLATFPLGCGCVWQLNLPVLLHSAPLIPRDSGGGSGE